MQGQPATGSQPLAGSPSLCTLRTSAWISQYSSPARMSNICMHPANTAPQPLWESGTVYSSVDGQVPGKLLRLWTWTWPPGCEISSSWDLQHGLEGGAGSGGMFLLGPVEPRSSEMGLTSTVLPLWEGYGHGLTQGGESVLEHAGSGRGQETAQLYSCGLSLPQGLCKMMALSQR